MSDSTPTSKTFVTHAFRGERFEGHAIPVTVLAELTAYHQLIVEIARAVFFRANPDRQRVPKGFEQRFELVLREIGEGSAVTALERRSSSRGQSGPAQLTLQQAGLTDADEFDQARDMVNELVEAVVSGRPAPARFPIDAARAFNLFGRSLLESESIEIAAPSGPRVVYDRQVRKRLVLLRESTYEDAVEVVGQVVQFDLQNRTFRLMSDGRVVGASLADLTGAQESVVRTAAAYTEAIRVRVVGSGAFDQSDQLQRIVRVDDVGFAEVNPPNSRRRLRPNHLPRPPNRPPLPPQFHPNGRRGAARHVPSETSWPRRLAVHDTRRTATDNFGLPTRQRLLRQLELHPPRRMPRDPHVHRLAS